MDRPDIRLRKSKPHLHIKQILRIFRKKHLFWRTAIRRIELAVPVHPLKQAGRADAVHCPVFHVRLCELPNLEDLPKHLLLLHIPVILPNAPKHGPIGIPILQIQVRFCQGNVPGSPRGSGTDAEIHRRVSIQHMLFSPDHVLDVRFIVLVPGKRDLFLKLPGRPDGVKAILPSIVRIAVLAHQIHQNLFLHCLGLGRRVLKPLHRLSPQFSVICLHLFSIF